MKPNFAVLRPCFPRFDLPDDRLPLLLSNLLRDTPLQRGRKLSFAYVEVFLFQLLYDVVQRQPFLDIPSYDGVFVGIPTLNGYLGLWHDSLLIEQNVACASRECKIRCLDVKVLESDLVLRREQSKARRGQKSAFSAVEDPEIDDWSTPQFCQAQIPNCSYSSSKVALPP